ncbi:MAG: antibiotic biosynthesis monooxygenase [Pseudomonadota bacterium]
MFIAMNQFQIHLEHAEEFEKVWIERDRRLTDVPGFLEFKLLRGETDKDAETRKYVSHTIWSSEEDFRSWTQSQNFRDAHKSAADNRQMYLGPPVFEGFTVVRGA